MSPFLYVQSSDTEGSWDHITGWEPLCANNVIKIFKFIRNSQTEDYFVIPFAYSELITKELPNLTQDFIYEELGCDPRKIICINKNIASLTTLILYSDINHFVNPEKIEELSLNILSLIFEILQENIDTDTYNSFLEIQGNIDDLIISCNKDSRVDKKILTNIFLIKNYIQEIINCNNPLLFQSGYIVDLRTGDAKIYTYSNDEDFTGPAGYDLISPKIKISTKAIECIRGLMSKPKPSDYPLNVQKENNSFVYDID